METKVDCDVDGNETILVVEDNAELRELTEQGDGELRLSGSRGGKRGGSA